MRFGRTGFALRLTLGRRLREQRRALVSRSQTEGEHDRNRGTGKELAST